MTWKLKHLLSFSASVLDGEDLADVDVRLFIRVVVCVCRTVNAQNCVFVLHGQEGQLLIFTEHSMHRLGSDGLDSCHNVQCI